MTQISKRGRRISSGHDSDCPAWVDEKCGCCLSWAYIDDDDFVEYDYETEDAIWQLENEEPPIRTSKTAKPKHGVDGRSIFTMWDKARGK